MLEYKPRGMDDPDYARFFTQARVIAWQFGFALIAHGSYTRDLDLLLVPWEARAFGGAVLPIINRIAQVTGTKVKGEPSAMPHGRMAWTLYLPGEHEVRWVDLSVMPCAVPAPAKDAAQSLTTPSPAGSPADRSVIADEQEASAGTAGPAVTRDPQPTLTVTRDPQGQAGPAQTEVDALSSAMKNPGVQELSQLLSGAGPAQLLTDAETPTPKPQEGIWTLTAPDGRTWAGDAPLRVCAAESRERVPATVRLARILRAAAEPDERARRWIERWYGSGPERGRWIWTEAGDRVAYLGEGEFADRLAEVLVARHNSDLSRIEGEQR